MIESEPKTIDKALALKQAGGNLELANELFAMLLDELPHFERGIRDALARRDWETLQNTVHKLNGAATYCGVPALKAAAEALESGLKRGRCEQAERGVQRVLEAIRQVQQHAHLRLA